MVREIPVMRFRIPHSSEANDASGGPNLEILRRNDTLSKSEYPRREGVSAVQLLFRLQSCAGSIADVIPG